MAGRVAADGGPAYPRRASSAPVVLTDNASLDSPATRYRPDLDGLRAVAVLAVVFYHAFPARLTGGFVGVDVFFVLSGFLISGIILRELDGGRFSFRVFYARRARRIFPALCAMLAVVLAYGFVVLLPVELAQLGGDVAGGAGFVSNLLLWHDAGYFDREALYKPLLHLWSLGVEEQFYVVWPLLLWMARGAGRWRLALLGCVAAASFALNCAQAVSNPVADFYSPATRLWELGTGALIAWHGLHGGVAGVPGWLRSVASIVGLLLILAASFALTPAMAFPGWLALLPVCGAGAIIGAGPDGWVNRVVLARRVPVAIGLISYPLYLWHWPLFSYAIILRNGRPPTVLLALGLIVASFVLATATYRLIETPVRRGGLRMGRVVATCGVLALVCAGGLGTWREAGFPSRFPAMPDLNVARVNAAIHDGVFRPTRNMDVVVLHRVTTTQIGAGEDTVVFAGDSLIFQYGPRVQQLYDEKRLRGTVYFVAGPSCAPVPGVIKDVMFADCIRMPYMAQDLIEARHAGTVVLGGFWQGYGVDHQIVRGGRIFRGGTLAARDALYANLMDYVQLLRKTARRVFLVGCAPASRAFDPSRMIERSVTGFRVNQDALRGVPRAALEKDCADSNRRLRDVALHTGAVVLDPFGDECGTGSMCPALFGAGEPKFADDKHLRPVFVRANVRFLDTALTR